MATDEDSASVEIECESDSEYEYVTDSEEDEVEVASEDEVEDASNDKHESDVNLDVQSLTIKDEKSKYKHSLPQKPPPTPPPPPPPKEEGDNLPLWASPGGFKLKKTGLADKMKKEGNLAAPVTFSPFKNEDFTNYVALPSRLKETEEGTTVKEGGYLSSPITHIRKVKKKKRVKKKKVKPT